MSQQELLSRVVRALTAAGVEYMVTGSVASSFQGEPRLTHDIDLVISLPVTVYFLTSFFRDLPPDLEEAALVDGTTRMGALWRIVLPLTAPGVFTTAILSFITVWNDFLFGLTLTADSSAQTVTVAIPLFNGEHQIQFGEVSAAAIIVTIPLVIMVLFLQRRIVSGLTAGAVKG